MSVNVRQKIRKLSSVQRKKVAARAAALIAEEMSLRELRKARKLTQTRVAKALGITQAASHGLKNAAICCFLRYEKRSRRWAVKCALWLNFPTARRSSSPISLKNIHGASRLGDLHGGRQALSLGRIRVPRASVFEACRSRLLLKLEPTFFAADVWRGEIT